MSFVSRGFRGRRRDADPARVPPGQYVTDDFPVLSAGPTPHTPLDAWDFTIVRRGRRAASLDVGGVPRAADRDGHGRHPLRDEVVQARHRLAGRVRRHAARRNRDRRRVRRPSRRRLYDQPAARRRHRGKGLGRVRVRRRAARAGARRPRAAARPAPLLLEEREVGARAASSGTRTSRASGRSTATTTTATRGESSGTGATELAGRGRRRASLDETPRVRTLALDVPAGPGIGPASTSTCASPPRTAIRRSAATRSRRRPTAPASSSPSSASTTARSRPT